MGNTVLVPRVAHRKEAYKSDLNAVKTSLDPGIVIFRKYLLSFTSKFPHLHFD